MGSLMKDVNQETTNISIRSKPSPLAPFHQQRHDFNRSPLESPPVAKKLLKVKNTNEISPVYQNAMTTSNFTSARNGKENCSILKKNNNSTSTTPKNILKHVDFQSDVRVFNFDRVAGDFVSTECQSLCIQPKDRKEFLSRTIQRKNNVGCNNVNLSDNRPIPELLPMAFVDKSSDLGETEFSFVEDASRQLWLKCIVNLGGHVSVENILVRANTSGNKIRIIGCRTIGFVRQEFNERFNLPMDVDPYRISAKMDSVSGKLLVEAPVRN